jgi:hypothetical protein
MVVTTDVIAEDQLVLQIMPIPPIPHQEQIITSNGVIVPRENGTAIAQLAVPPTDEGNDTMLAATPTEMGLTHELSDTAATTEAHGEDTRSSTLAHDRVAVVTEIVAHETQGDDTGISAPAHDRVAMLEDEQGNAASSAAKQATPPPPANSASAKRRSNSFTLKVKRLKPSAILQRPSPDKTVHMPRQRPLRSRRITAQSLSRIPASKRGEYLVLKHLGQASPLSESTAKNKFDTLFGQNPEDDEAPRELFLDGTNIGGRRRRRRAPRARA